MLKTLSDKTRSLVRGWFLYDFNWAIIFDFELEIFLGSKVTIFFLDFEYFQTIQISTFRAIYTYALAEMPNRKSLWLSAAQFEKNHGTPWDLLLNFSRNL